VANYEKMKRTMNRLPLRVLAVMVLITMTTRVISQELQFALHADPIISWMSSNKSEYKNEGVKAGFSMGLNVLYFFDKNYAVSSGISFLSAGGRQSAIEPHTMVFNNFTKAVAAGDEMKYNLHYMNIPVGLRLQTNQIGYLTYFTDLGFDIRMLVKSTVDIPASQISGENAKNEVYGMNAGWHIYAGVEYELNIDASLIAGLGYDQDFFDVTKDLENVSQPDDRSGLRMIRFRFGIKF
jgi:hypothetical protein